MSHMTIACLVLAALTVTPTGGASSAQETPHLGRVIDLSETPMVEGLGPPDLPQSMDATPFYCEGVWHLFHLQNGGALAHRTSRDLVHWKIEPVAVWSGNPGDADGANIAPGTVVKGHDGRFYLLYTGNQNVCLATSDDLYTWVKHGDNPVLAGDGVHASPANFRDPFVFHNEEEQCWWMLVGTQVPGRFYQRSGCVGLAKSDDLIKWRLAEPLWAPGFGQPCDCPQVLKHGDLWYLFTLDRNAHYRIARSLDGPWQRPPVRSWIPSPSFAMSRPATDGRRWVTFPFMCSREGQSDQGDVVQARLYSVPRQIGFEPDGSLTERALPELVDAILAKPALEEALLSGARSVVGTWSIEGTSIGSSPSVEANLLHVSGVPDSYYLEADLTLSTTKMDFSLVFRAAPDLGVAYVLDFLPEEKQLALRPYQNWDNRSVLATNYCDLPIGRPMKVRLFVCGTAMEVFIDDKWSLCHSVYQHSSGGLFIEHRDGSATLSNIKVRRLQGELAL